MKILMFMSALAISVWLATLAALWLAGRVAEWTSDVYL